MIHPTAIIHSKARIGPNCAIGPFTVIDEGVEIAADCQIGPHVYLTGNTLLGAGNKVHAGCVIGDLPQDLRFTGEPTGVTIGSNNVFREHITVHRSNNNPAEPTRIGSNNFLMANCHVGHNSAIGNHVIIANGTLLGGHVTVQDRAFISGNCLLHQFVRVGAYALMQGGSGISKDLPPYTIARGINHIGGLNLVALRRAGFTAEQRLELRQLYHALFRSRRKLSEALHEARARFTSPQAAVLFDFLAQGKRGFCSEEPRSTQSSEIES